MKAYAAAYALTATHFAGAISAIAIVLSCAWLFYHVVMRKNLDLFLVFLLLIPSIVFSSPDPGVDAAAAPGFFDRLVSVVYLGPIALSTRLVLSLAIITRVALRFKQIRLRALTLAWFTAILLAGIGLVYSVLAGNENPAGLTVGFRIALSVGAVLVPLCVRDREHLRYSLDRVLYLSMGLLVLGFTTGHWMFIAFGLIPYAWMRFRPRILALFPLIYAIRIVASQSSTLTGLGIIVSSLTFLILLGTNRLTNHMLRWRPIMLAGIALPILVTILVLRLPAADSFDFTSIRGYAEFKLLGDRKPVWDASYDQITTSSPIVVPAGSVMDVYFGFLDRSVEWPSGSHNIFLEIARQIGLLGMILLTIVMLTMLYRTGRRMHTLEELVLFYCFLAIYIVFGITGNSLVYDGVGAFYWLLVGQLYQTAPRPVRRRAMPAAAAAANDSAAFDNVIEKSDAR